MATCYVCHKGTLKGHWVSHSNIKTRRFFKPNLHTLKVEFKNKTIKQVKICSKCYKKMTTDFWKGKILPLTPLSLLNQKKVKDKLKPVTAKTEVKPKPNGQKKGTKS